MENFNNPAIFVQNLVKYYSCTDEKSQDRFSLQKRHVVAAIDGLNLEVRKGEFFGLLGHNGAGKTTLVKTICTLLRPDHGKVMVNGYDVVKSTMEVRASIGTLFSVGERGFFWRLNGYNNLEFFAAVYNVPHERIKERVMEVLRLVGLENNAFMSFQKYSGGMKRKLSLARALLPDPPILVLDEPTTGLDVAASRSIREIIKNDLVKKEGKTVLYSTHYIEEASQMCDRIGIMKKGKIVMVDTPENIRRKVRKGERVELVTNRISWSQENAIRTLTGVVSVETGIHETIERAMRIEIGLDDINTLCRVLDYFSKAGIGILDFKRIEPSLEDAYIELSGAQVSRCR